MVGNTRDELAKAKAANDYASVIDILNNDRTAESYYKLGKMYLEGEGVEKNERTAAGYFFTSHDMGYVSATIMLINLLNQNKLDLSYRGDIDLEHLYREAANHNHAQVQYLYGNFLKQEAAEYHDEERRQSTLKRDSGIPRFDPGAPANK